MPPYEEDELISSWLDRVARFCGFSVDALLSENGLDPSKVDLAAIDIGLRCARFAPLANLLNTSVSALADRTIASAYPWATNFLARDWGFPLFGSTASLRAAACSWCLEQQRLNSGFSWLRREWVLACRTICPQHGVRLIEGGDAAIAPGWDDFFRSHPWVQQATCAGPLISTPFQWAAPRQSAGPIEQMNERLLQIQNILAADPNAGSKSAADDGPKLALVIRDILWALTRADRAFPKQITFALPSS